MRKMTARQIQQATPRPSLQVLVVADRADTAIVQEGQPPAQMSAYLLDIPDGGNALQTAADFVTQAGFTVGTVCRVLDLSESPLQMLVFRLDSQWVPA